MDKENLREYIDLCKKYTISDIKQMDNKCLTRLKNKYKEDADNIMVDIYLKYHKMKGGAVPLAIGAAKLIATNPVARRIAINQAEKQFQRSTGITPHTAIARGRQQYQQSKQRTGMMPRQQYRQRINRIQTPFYKPQVPIIQGINRIPPPTHQPQAPITNLHMCGDRPDSANWTVLQHTTYNGRPAVLVKNSRNYTRGPNYPPQICSNSKTYYKVN